MRDLGLWYSMDPEGTISERDELRYLLWIEIVHFGHVGRSWAPKKAFYWVKGYRLTRKLNPNW